MDAPKIVTGLVILSFTAIGCNAKFHAVRGSDSEPAAEAAPGPVPAPVAPRGPIATPVTPPVTPTAPPTSTPNTCDTQYDESIGRDRVVVKKTVTFYRGRQMVWRKNCDGKIISKKYENLSTATRKTISFDHPGARSWSAFNRTTCTSMNPTRSVLVGERARLSLPVSLRSSENALKVHAGRNYIDYEVAKRGGGTERGTLILTVKISDSTGDCVVIKARNCPATKPEPQAPSMFGYL